MSYDDYFREVKRFRHFLTHVPEEYKDDQMCLAAIRNDGSNLEAVPKTILEKDFGCFLCLEAVINRSPGSLKDVPKKHLSYDMCLRAVQNSGWAFEFVPVEFRDEQMCLLAVKNVGAMLEHVPEHLKTACQL